MLKSLLIGRAHVASAVPDGILALVRVYVGLVMALAHGLGKVQDPSGAIGAAEGLGFPAPSVFGWAAALSEFLGGLFLAAGLLTRPAAFFVLVTMLVAAFGVHQADPFGKKEFALAYAALALAFLALGSGRFGIDRWLAPGPGT